MSTPPPPPPAPLLPLLLLLLLGPRPDATTGATDTAVLLPCAAAAERWSTTRCCWICCWLLGVDGGGDNDGDGLVDNSREGLWSSSRIESALTEMSVVAWGIGCLTPPRPAL